MTDLANDPATARVAAPAVTPAASLGNTADDRLPIGQKIAYGLGGLTDYFYINFPLALFMPIYAIAMKMDPAALGVALAIPKVIGAVLDPFVGSLSDNARTRWGRRKPFIMVGGVMGSLLLPLMWYVPAGGAWVQYGYVTSMVALLCVFDSVFATPYGAMGYELSTGYDERTRVLATRGYVQLFGIFSAAWFYRICCVKTLFGHPVFANEVVGVRWLSVLIAAVMMGGAVCVVCLVRERRDVGSASQKQSPIPVVKALGITLRNRDFLHLEAALLAQQLALGVTSTLGMYIHFKYMCGNDRTLAGDIGAWGGTLTTFSAFLGMPLGLGISRRLGKRDGAFTGAAINLLSVALLPWLLTPRYRWLVIIGWVIQAMGQQCCNLMFGSMTADICDEDELLTGHRREGAFAAVNNTLNRAMTVVMLLAAGVLPRLVGFTDARIDPTIDQLRHMKYLLIAIQFAGVLATLALLRVYPVTRARAGEVRRLLEERKRSVVA